MRVSIPEGCDRTQKEWNIYSSYKKLEWGKALDTYVKLVTPTK